MQAEIKTRRTVVDAWIGADGAVRIFVNRDGKQITVWAVEREDAPPKMANGEEIEPLEVGPRLPRSTTGRIAADGESEP